MCSLHQRRHAGDGSLPAPPALQLARLSLSWLCAGDHSRQKKTIRQRLRCPRRCLKSEQHSAEFAERSKRKAREKQEKSREQNKMNNEVAPSYSWLLCR